MDVEKVIEAGARALCRTSLAGKRCPCDESSAFACADEHPGIMARACLTAALTQARAQGAVLAVVPADVQNIFGDDRAKGHAEGWCLAIAAMREREVKLCSTL